MGAKSRNKGKRGEREVTALAHKHGLWAERTWQTAQNPDASTRACDVEIEGQPYQVKISANGFRKLYRELENVNGFFLRCDRGDWLVVLRAADYLSLLGTCGQPQPTLDQTGNVREP